MSFRINWDQEAKDLIKAIAPALLAFGLWALVVLLVSILWAVNGLTGWCWSVVSLMVSPLTPPTPSP